MGGAYARYVLGDALQPGSEPFRGSGSRGRSPRSLAQSENEIALVALAARPGEEKMAGIASATESGSRTWEFALVVLDTWQRRGVGRRLMIALMEALQERRGESIEGDVLALNRNMLDFVARLGFAIYPHPDQSHVKPAPSYLAFALSFFVIRISWVNHHDLLRLVRAESRGFLLANGQGERSPNSDCRIQTVRSTMG